MLYFVSTDPDSAGRDSSQMRRPWESAAVPPSRLEAPETTSAVIGEFQEPYGAVSLFSLVGTSFSSEEEEEAILLQLQCCLLAETAATSLRLMWLKRKMEQGEVDELVET